MLFLTRKLEIELIFNKLTFFLGGAKIFLKELEFKK